MNQHSQGSGSSYVAGRGVKKLELAVTAASRSEATQLETAIKQLPKSKKQSQLKQGSDIAYQHVPGLTTEQDA